MRPVLLLALALVVPVAAFEPASAEHDRAPLVVTFPRENETLGNVGFAEYRFATSDVVYDLSVLVDGIVVEVVAAQTASDAVGVVHFDLGARGIPEGEHELRLLATPASGAIGHSTLSLPVTFLYSAVDRPLLQLVTARFDGSTVAFEGEFASASGHGRVGVYSDIGFESREQDDGSFLFTLPAWVEPGSYDAWIYGVDDENRSALRHVPFTIRAPEVVFAQSVTGSFGTSFEVPRDGWLSVRACAHLAPCTGMGEVAGAVFVGNEEASCESVALVMSSGAPCGMPVRAGDSLVVEAVVIARTDIVLALI